MKENKMDEWKLEDADLEGVSGGIMEKSTVTLPCIYCGVEQKMSKYSHVSVRCGNYVYRDAIKYICPDKTRLFYVIKEDGKGWIMTDVGEVFPAALIYY